MTAPNADPPLTDDDLSGPERLLRQAAGTGTLVDLSTGEAAADDAGRTVRAEVLVELLTRRRADDPGQPRAVKLRGARITGQLDLEGAELVCPLLLADCHLDEAVNLVQASASVIYLPGCHLPGLAAEQLRTTGNLELHAGFTVKGEVTLLGAHIGGRLTFAGAHLTNPDGRALSASGLTVERDITCRDGFTAEGEVHLRGAAIGGSLDLTGAHLSAPGADAVAAARLSVGHDVFCADMSVDGEVRLPGAHIRGRLDLSRARLTNAGATAVTADRLTVDDGVLGERLVAEGEVRLVGAHIGGALVLAGARLTNPAGCALQADGIVVDQDVQATDGFIAEGAVRMAGARIGGLLSFDGATLTSPGQWALYAFRLSAAGGVHCRAGFRADGEVLLSGARTEGYVDLSDSTLSNPGRQVLDLSGVNAVALVLRPRHRPDGAVDLTNARVGIFDDDAATWPTSLRLRGFGYDSLGLHADMVDVRTRLRWLARDPGGYVPQLYDQLAAAYRRAGDEQGVRKVEVAKQWRRRAVLGPVAKLTNWLLYLTIGYGYRTRLAALWLAGLLACGTWIFDRAHPSHMLRTETRGPGFHALAYALDVLVPIVDLGQQRAWQPQGAAMYWSWAFMGAGWVLTTAVAAALTGLARRTRT